MRNLDDIAIGDESSIAALLDQINLHKDLAITHDLIDNLRQVNQDSIKDDNKFYMAKQNAVQALETKFGLQRRIVVGRGELGVGNI